LDERLEEVGNKVGKVLSQNNTLVSTVNDISPKLAVMEIESQSGFDKASKKIDEVLKQASSVSEKLDEATKNLAVIGTDSQSGFDKASKQVSGVITQNDSLSKKLDTVSLTLVNISNVCGRALEKSVETDKQLEAMLTGSEKSLGAISALNKSVDHSYSNLDKTIGTQSKEVLELLEYIGRIDNNTNETKDLVDNLLQSNEILSDSFKESTVRDEVLRKSIRNNRWVVVIGTLLISSVIVAFEMNIITKI
jgi:hypothetical protein